MQNTDPPQPSARLVSIYRYPVKGLSADPVSEVHLQAGECLPFDRAYAIENGPSRFDAFHPRHVQKSAFLTLMRNAALAELTTRFDAATQTLTIERDSGRVAQGRLGTPDGRAIIAQFFAEYLKEELRGPPRVVHAEGHNLTDIATKALHIVNLASVADLERAVGHAIDPLRFRPNLIVDTGSPWSEWQWIGRTLSVGPAAVKVFARTGRCAATNVDPGTGQRDLDIPAKLLRRWGHGDFGVYALVTQSGEIRPGDSVCAL